MNVARQQSDKGSMLAWYTRLMELRRKDPALRGGAYLPLDSGNPDVVAYGRVTRSGEGVLVLLNMSGECQSLKITGWPGQTPRAGAVVMASPLAGPGNLVDPVLEPYPAQLVRFAPAAATK